MQQRGWSELDVIFVSGDAYIDHPAFGVPLLARWLESRGFRVGIIAQPDWRTKDAFMVLGKPRLFFAVSAGAMDSMVAHYTPARKLRHDDAYTPGNRHGARPNRATIIYTSRLSENCNLWVSRVSIRSSRPSSFSASSTLRLSSGKCHSKSAF